jgi:hypothetical protein
MVNAPQLLVAMLSPKATMWLPGLPTAPPPPVPATYLPKHGQPLRQGARVVSHAESRFLGQRSRPGFGTRLRLSGPPSEHGERQQQLLVHARQ